MTRRHLLVLGAGSAGKRHLRNFRGLGFELSAMDPRADRLEEAARETPLVRRFAGEEEAFREAGLFGGVVVCSPPRAHVPQCLKALKAGLPVFLEKPVSPDLASARELRDAAEASRVPLLLGYTYRWWPALRELRRRILAGEIGRPLGVRCVMSAHLADWHPWERYQDFFMASREQGGGALLDESHFLDLLLWIFGMPRSVFARVERLSSLEIDTDDNVDAWLAYENGLRCVLHLDLYGRPHEKYITVAGETGTLHWSFDPNRIRLGRGPAQEWEDTTFGGERNDMFLAAARDFADVLEGKAAPSCTALDGVRVLEVVEAMRRSHAEGREVPAC